jgi:hypothetical protein
VYEHDGEADRRGSPAWTLVVASLALMMAFLDSLVVTTALPALQVWLQAASRILSGRSTPTTSPSLACC